VDETALIRRCDPGALQKPVWMFDQGPLPAITPRATGKRGDDAALRGDAGVLKRG
jgi:hypothetical protein